MNKKYLTLINKTISLLIIAANLYVLILIVQVIVTGGGPMGYGLLALPYLISFHAFTYSSIKGLVGPKNLRINLLFNCVGFIWVIGSCILVFRY